MLKTARADYWPVTRLSPMVVGLVSEGYGRQLWSRVKVRKAHTCAACGGEILVNAFKPVTNANNRMERLCCACIERVVP